MKDRRSRQRGEPNTATQRRALLSRKQSGEGDLTSVAVQTGDMEIQGLDLSGFTPVTGKAAGAAASPRINFLLILSSSPLSVEQDLLL